MYVHSMCVHVYYAYEDPMYLGKEILFLSRLKDDLMAKTLSKLKANGISKVRDYISPAGGPYLAGCGWLWLARQSCQKRLNLVLRGI